MEQTSSAAECDRQVLGVEVEKQWR